jgi:uncharacterized membrane protein
MLYLDARDIALDEPFTIYYSQQSFNEIIDMLYSENNPPLHFFFLHFWIKLFGIGAWSVRMPSLIFSALTAPVIYRIGQRFISARAGVIASLIFTLSTMHIYFSHEARVYTLFVLLASLSLYYFLCIGLEPGRKRHYLLLFIVNLLLIYSHYFGFFVLLMEVVSLPFIYGKRRAWKGIAIVMCALALSYIPLLFIFFHRVGASVNGTWVAPPGVTEVYGNLNRFINNKYSMLALIIVMTIIIMSRLVKKELLARIRTLFAGEARIVILLWFAVPYLLMFAVSFKVPMFIDRYILYTSIPFYLLIATAFVHFIDHPAFQAVAAGLFLLVMVKTIDLNPDNDRKMKEWIATVKSMKQPGTLVLLSPHYADMGFTYHYNIEYFKDYRNMRKLLAQEHIYPVGTFADAEALLKSNTGDCIYLEAGNEFTDPEDRIYKTIASQYRNHEKYFVYKIFYVHRFY